MSTPLQLLLLQQQALRLEFTSAMSAQHGLDPQLVQSILVDDDDSDAADAEDDSGDALSNSDDEREYQAFIEQVIHPQTSVHAASVPSSSVHTIHSSSHDDQSSSSAGISRSNATPSSSAVPADSLPSSLSASLHSLLDWRSPVASVSAAHRAERAALLEAAHALATRSAAAAAQRRGGSLH